jgi:integrase
MGCLYRRGKIYWIKYYRNGKAIMESTQSDKKEVASRLLKQREGEISKGEIPGIYFDRVIFDELAEDILADYRINQKKTLIKAERSVKNLKKSFGGMRVTVITTDKIKTYIEDRMAKGLSNASINRELAALKRMLHLGARSTPPKVGRVPFIPMLKESNVRKGFFEHEEFIALREALPFPLDTAATFAYHTGWRRGEIFGLTWDKVDLKQGIIRLDPGMTKNDEARTVYLNRELMEAMRSLHVQRQIGSPYVFHRNGKPIVEFRDAWDKACRKAGLQGMLFHDLRRTAVRNLVRAGVPERVAMQISGHKTRIVFDRYNIVNQEDLREAARKQQAYVEGLAVTADGYNLVTFDKKKAS